MLKLETRQDLQRLVDEGLEESLTLEYKSSMALSRESAAISELCKDVSALANSAGGQLIYGIEEDKKTKRPNKEDNGVIDDKITREWIIQIINSRVQPRMDEVTVVRILLSAEGYGYVIGVPPTQVGPHQSPEKKYYKRFELHSVPMEDYEIRDVMRRSSTPNLYLALNLGPGDRRQWRFTSPGRGSDPIPLVFTIGNKSSPPAAHVIVTIGIDARLSITSTGDYEGPLARQGDGNLIHFRLLISPPHWLPIFKEAADDLLSKREFHVRMGAEPSIPKGYQLTGKVQTPGFVREQSWLLTDEHDWVHLTEIE
jgi:Putative DNA-binding domain